MEKETAIDILNELNGAICPTIINEDFFIGLLEERGQID